jgi:hypothetical protein
VFSLAPLHLQNGLRLAKPLSIARIQGFPDSWHFTGKKTVAYRQVGNAFPPLVAKAVGRSIHFAFNKKFSYVDIPIEPDMELRLLEGLPKLAKPCRVKRDRKL